MVEANNEKEKVFIFICFVYVQFFFHGRPYIQTKNKLNSEIETTTTTLSCCNGVMILVFISEDSCVTFSFLSIIIEKKALIFMI